MTRARQKDEERCVFAAFAKVCPYGIKTRSNRWHDPPSPDVVSTTAIGRRGFELTHAVNPRTASRINAIERFLADCRKALCQCPDRERRLIDEKYGNADIGCVMRQTVAKAARCRAARALVSRLAQGPPVCSGLLDVSNVTDL